MERMRKEKSGTLLGVGTAYLPVKEIKGEFYVKVSDFTRCMDGIRIEQEADRKHIEQLEEENKKLKNDLMEDMKEITKLEEENKVIKEEKEMLIRQNTLLQESNKKLKEDIKEIEKSQEYRYHRCMKAERQVQHSLDGDDEEGLYD